MADELFEYKQTIANLVVETWKFRSSYMRMLKELNAGESAKYINKINWLDRQITENLGNVGMKLVNLEGTEYRDGTAATPLNIDEFGADDLLYVEQMIEPIIMEDDKLIRTGTVMLRRIEK